MGDALSTLLFQPPRPTPIKESKLVFLPTSRGSRIPTFYLERPKAKITFLYSHANAEDLGTVYPWIKFLAKTLNVNILAYDYTGYGLSKEVDQPSEEHCFADIDACYKYLTEEKNIAPSSIVLYGRSLGSGPSCYLANKTAESGESVGGLILHAPFLSVYRVVIESGCTLIGDKFPNVDFAPGIRCPVLIIHGTSDRIVPFWHGQRLLRSVPPCCRTRALFIEGMGHNHVNVRLRPLFAERVSSYLADYVDTQVASKIDRDGMSNVISPLSDEELMEITHGPDDVDPDNIMALNGVKFIQQDYDCHKKSGDPYSNQVIAVSTS